MDELLAAGVPDGRFDADRFARVAEPFLDGIDGLAALVDELPARFAAIEACGLPATLVHGDLHPGNVRADGDSRVIVDWGDATVGHPAYDILRLTGELDEPGPVLREWARRWRTDRPGAEPERAVALIRPVAELRAAAAYADFLDRIEPSEWPYHAADVPARCAPRRPQPYGGGVTDQRSRFVEELRRNGAPLTPELAAAFAAVPREAFVAEGFQRRDGSWARPGTAGFRAAVYRDDVLVTKVDGGTAVSSSSQPSLMAIMLAALDVRPGDRVLEIGAGTGYNAALLAALGARVTSVDVQADVADRARAALAAAGVEGVRVLIGDGYSGAPGESFDRAIVTVGVAGISPAWLAQTRPGPVVAPVEHAGTHPVLAVEGGPEGPVTATVICPSGFMSAAGPLTATHPWSHPHPVSSGTLAPFAPFAPPRWETPLSSYVYRDLWYAAGVWSRRATHAALPDRELSGVVLLDERGAGGAAIMPDGSVLAGGERADDCGAAAVEIVDRWEAAGRPPMRAWRIGLRLAGDPRAPIWAPATWSLPAQP
ncbi:phosphotransferase [Actinoplanes nipponensis]|uniref:phosphotransferase n=1 Tax=Actinoplanes nipponensis TaxID=135950 RepID=UPI0031F0290B